MRADDSGFTIVEALVAFAILSVVLMSLYGASGTALHSVGRAQNVDEALLLARSKLAEIAAKGTVVSETSGGAFAGTDKRWKLDAKDIDPQDEGALRLQEIHLEIMWQEDGSDRSLAVATRHLGRALQ